MLINAQRLAAVAAAGALTALAPAAAQAAIPGTLDPSFGSGGITAAPAGARLFGAAVQADGKVVAVGESGAGSSATLIVTRFNSNGSPDTSFGSGGVASGPPISGTFKPNSLGRGVAIQPDGKIVVVGKATSADGSGRFALIVERFNSGGSLDASFGTGGVTTLLNTQFGDGYAVAVQPDGKIVATGTADTDGTGGVAPRIAVVRLNSNGSLDPGFGAGGIDEVDLGAYSYALAVALQSDGKVVIAGSQAPALQVTNALLARLTPTGAPDPSFNGNGMFATQYARGAAFSAFNAVAVQADGSIVAAGAANDGNTAADTIVARFTPAGTADAGFGTGGVTYTPSAVNLPPSAPTVPGANAVAIASNGDIVAAGTAADAILTTGAVWAFTPAGAPDSSFGNHGVSVLPVSTGSISETNALAISPTTGDFVTVGDSQPAPYSGTSYTGLAAGFVGFPIIKPPPPPPPLPPTPALKLTLKGVNSSYRTSTVAKHGLEATVGCNEACSLKVTLTITAKVAKQLGRRVRGNGTVTLATARRSLRQSGTTSVTLRLSSALARAMEKQRSVTVTLSVSGTSTATLKSKLTSKRLQFRR